MTPLKPKKNWFINISNISISNDIAGLLQGEGFCLPTLNKERNMIECIKSVDNNSYKH